MISFSETMLIAVLVQRAGGRVEISAQELAEIRRCAMRQHFDLARNVLVVEVAEPVIDADFTVVGVRALPHG